MDTQSSGLADKINLAEVKARSKAGWQDKQHYLPQLNEAYEFAIPYRKPVDEAVTQSMPGENRVDRVFDNTAIVSTVRFAGKLQNDLLPPEQSFFTLEAGPISKMVSEDAAAFTQTLQQDATVINALFQGGEFSTAVQEMFLDLAAGTGAMLILPGDEERPVRFVAVPISEIALEAGAYSDISAIFFKKKWSKRAIKSTWPKGHFSDALKKDMEDAKKQSDTLVICQDTYWNPEEKKWVLVVYVENDKETKPIAVSTSRACPWAVPRYYKVAGETYGRGPIQVTLPTIKSLNKAQELSLKAAAFAILGIWTAVDDGVFNPKMARLAPGAIWRVARNGGLLGPSVQKLDLPGRFDTSQIVLNELRMQVKEGLLDQQLPPDGATPRSASEIMERVKRLASEHNGALGRLVQEGVVPMVRRVMEIAHDKGLLVSKQPIDRLLIDIKITSPMAVAMRAQQAKIWADFIQLCEALLMNGTVASEIIELYEMLAEIGRSMGVPEKYLKTKGQQRQVQKQIEQGVQQAMAAAVEAQKQQQQAAGLAAPAAA